MFCPNCGKRCDSGLFCWNCGTKLPAGPLRPCPADSRPVKNGSAPDPFGIAAGARPHRADEKTDETMDEGVLFTNLRVLAGKLDSDTETVGALLEAYVEASLAHGIRYRIIDVSDYCYLNPAAAGRRIHLSPSDPWSVHISPLADHYRYGRRSAEEKSCYLFIVGGEDIIPMPVVPHYIDDPGFGDKDIATDIPYAYLMGERTYAMLQSGELFEYEQYFQVGRLPVPKEASLHYLRGYMKRAIENCGKLEVESAYGQTDRTWLSASASVSAPVRRRGVRMENDRFDDRIFDRNLYVSPCVEKSIVDRIFDRRADLYYFNLHGSDNPAAVSFYAEFEKTPYEAVTPAQLARAEKPNIVVTEACYGARFDLGYNTTTMLCSALANRTILYLGSSRIALGASHSDGPADLNCADRMACVFMACLLEGYPAGDALFLARRSFFGAADSRLLPQQALTIVEFNLFGDPFLRIRPRCDAGESFAGGKRLSDTPVDTVVESKCLYRAAPASPLEQIRNAVDRNLMLIRQAVDRKLYAQLGVEPRSLSTISRIRYKSGAEFYTFNYAEERGFGVCLHTAVTDSAGNIQTIISTK